MVNDVNKHPPAEGEAIGWLQRIIGYCARNPLMTLVAVLALTFGVVIKHGWLRTTRPRGDSSGHYDAINRPATYAVGDTVWGNGCDEPQHQPIS